MDPTQLVVPAFLGYFFWMQARRKNAWRTSVQRNVGRSSGHHSASCVISRRLRAPRLFDERHAVGSTTTRSIACSWYVPRAQPPRVLWQIADKSLDSMLKGVKEAFPNSHRVWEAAYPNKVETGDPELDKRFVVYAIDRMRRAECTRRRTQNLVISGAQGAAADAQSAQLRAASTAAVGP